jgi:hypothetical protein
MAGHRTLTFTAAMGVGVLGTAIGLGEAPAHASKVGWSTPSVIGTAVLLAGLALLVVGAVGLIRAVRGWWRLLALPIAYLIAQFILLPIPQSIAATHVRRIALGAATPADHGLAFTDVALWTRDGVRLAPATTRTTSS